ncbi:hypothetical protein [Streptomyces sp. NPDC058295]|uniref:hypothetical protein n=1 Tax=Streptomyces sp. NPDC058295 TaxID=3346431 RepID=UPI0036E56F05
MHEAAVVEPELRELVDQWCDEVVSAVEAGLGQAGRSDPDSRRLRGFLALTQLGRLARRWMRHGWETDPATAPVLPADSRQFVLGEPHGGPAEPPPRGTA